MTAFISYAFISFTAFLISIPPSTVTIIKITQTVFVVVVVVEKRRLSL